MKLDQKKIPKKQLFLLFTTASLILLTGCSPDENRVKSDTSVHSQTPTADRVARSADGRSSDGYILPPSIPGDMGVSSGGSIVMRQVYHQVSIVDVKESIRFDFRESQSDTYTATAVNLPDGLSIQMNSPKKRFFVTGVPTATALAESPFETEITLSNSSDSRTVKFQWHIRDGVRPSTNTSFRACGGNPGEGGTLWSWAWAGKEQEHIQTASSESLSITRLEDLSGNDHYYYGTGRGHASEVGYTWRTYYTPYPTVGLDESIRSGVNYGGQFLKQNGNMAASGPFYLAAAVMNSRTGGNGNREVFGSLQSGDGYRYTQGPENTTNSDVGVLALKIDGTSKALTERYSYTTGPMLIEILRDNDNVVRAMVNGVDLTIGGGVTMPGVFNLSGLSSESVSGFDDAGFEFIACKGLPSQTERSEAREYLRSKWNLYPGTGNEETGVCR